MMRSPSGSPSCWVVRSLSPSAHVLVPEGGPGQLRERLRQQQQGPPRRAQARADVLGREVRGIGVARGALVVVDALQLGSGFAHAAPSSSVANLSARSASSSAAVGGSLTPRPLDALERPAGGLARLLDGDAGMQARERQLARLGVGLEHAEVGHDDGHAGAAADRAARASPARRPARRSCGSRARRRRCAASVAASRSSRRRRRRSRARRRRPGRRTFGWS